MSMRLRESETIFKWIRHVEMVYLFCKILSIFFCYIGFGIFGWPIIRTVWSKLFIFHKLAGNEKNEKIHYPEDTTNNKPQFDAYWKLKVKKPECIFCCVKSFESQWFFFSLICVCHCGIQSNETVCMSENHLVKTGKNLFAYKSQTFSKY